MGKSFYDLDGLIELNDKRIYEFSQSLERIQDKYPVPLIIYSAIAIYLVQVVQHGIKHDFDNWVYYISLVLFGWLFLISMSFFVLLILWNDRLYVQRPKIFYRDTRLLYEQGLIMPADQEKVDQLVKASYIDDQEAVLDDTIQRFVRKRACYVRALVFGLLSVIPFLVCLIFHFSGSDDKFIRREIMKSHLSLLHQQHIMSQTQPTPTPQDGNIIKVYCSLPGINGEIIKVAPMITNEGSTKIR